MDEGVLLHHKGQSLLRLAGASSIIDPLPETARLHPGPSELAHSRLKRMLLLKIEDRGS